MAAPAGCLLACRSAQLGGRRTSHKQRAEAEQPPAPQPHLGGKQIAAQARAGLATAATVEEQVHLVPSALQSRGCATGLVGDRTTRSGFRGHCKRAMWGRVYNNAQGGQSAPCCCPAQQPSSEEESRAASAASRAAASRAAAPTCLAAMRKRERCGCEASLPMQNVKRLPPGPCSCAGRGGGIAGVEMCGRWGEVPKQPCTHDALRCMRCNTQGVRELLGWQAAAGQA